MTRRTFAWGLEVLAIGFAVACSSSSESNGASTPDAGIGAEDGAAPHDGGVDSASELDASPATCEGPCKITTLVAKFGSVERTLDRAQFGLTRSDGGTVHHVEAHLGGTPECPSRTSPSPNYTLVFSSVPRTSPNGDVSEGVTSAFFDFKGDFGLPPLIRAKSVKIHGLTTDPSASPRWTALDVTVTFDEGSIAGHVYAQYCDSLSE